MQRQQNKGEGSVREHHQRQASKPVECASEGPSEWGGRGAVCVLSMQGVGESKSGAWFSPTRWAGMSAVKHKWSGQIYPKHDNHDGRQEGAVPRATRGMCIRGGGVEPGGYTFSI